MTEATLGEICETGGGKIQTGPFGSQLHKSDYQREGTPVVMPSDIVDSHVVTDDIARVGDKILMKLSRHKLRRGDVVIARRGDIGRCTAITSREEGWLCGTGCLRVTLGQKADVDSQFLYYYLSRPSVTEWLENHAVGATMANLNTEILSRTPISYPPLRIQRRIAGILSAYDDLIENNTRRIQLLEEMARSIYREWFVHHRFPGHENAAMRETDELGLVPEGWEVVKLGDVASVNRANVRKDATPEEIHYITISCIEKGSISGIETLPYSKAPSRAKRIVQHGDILWSKVRPNLEGYGLVLNPAANTIASTGFAVISPEKAPYSYLYPALTTKEFVTYLVNRASGAAYPAVKIRDFKNAFVLLPPKRLLESFDSKVKVLFEMKQRLTMKNKNLRRTRDLLLPRLVSGEIDVGEAENVLETN